MKFDAINSRISQDFTKARGKAFFSRIKHFLRNENDQLMAFADVKKILKPDHEVYKGMRTVPIDHIIGSEGRYQDFTKCFFPKSEHLRMRWESIDKARLQNINLPPIQLYEIGDVYFVRDGNHRVSVAKAQGIEYIDAEVTSLSSEIILKPNMNLIELRSAVIEMEKKLFLEKTNFEKITGDKDLHFSRIGRYDEIYNHILVHKYYLNQSVEEEIPLKDAVLSWYTNIYKPIIDVVKSEQLNALFPKRTLGDFYVWIVKHWDYLKKTYNVKYTLTDAIGDWVKKHKPISQEMLRK
jgi:hypothetical protein